MTPTAFNEALSDPEVSNIQISGTIPLDSTLDISRSVTITGGKLTASSTGKVVQFVGDNHIVLDGVTLSSTIATPTDWSSSYCVQFYEGSATVRNCTFEGGNAAMLVNGATVTLEGSNTIDGAGFGGIEVSTGSADPGASILNVGSGTITYADESYGKPAVWIDGTSTEVGQVIYPEGYLTEITYTKPDESQQLQYYLDPAHAVDPVNAEVTE